MNKIPVLSGQVRLSEREVQELATAVHRPGLREIVEGFHANIAGPAALLTFPFMLLMWGSAERVRFTAFFAALLSTGFYSNYKSLSAEQHAQLDAVVKRYATRLDELVDLPAQEYREFDSVIDRMYADTMGRTAIQTLLQAAHVRAWSSLESLAEDLWEYSLNTGIDSLGAAAAERVLSDQEVQKNRIDGFTGQAVQVHVLARYGWNVSGRVGTLLRGKYDFTSVSGINRAFGVIFRDRPPVPRLVNTDELRQAELLRHVIVHRAGIVDEEYRKATETPCPLGQRVELTSAQIAASTKLIISEGCSLIRSVETALAEPRAQEPRS